MKSPRERSLEHACLVAKIADDFRGRETVVLDLTGVTPIADYFVITTGTSGRQLHGIADEVRKTLKTRGERPLGEEGYETASWILVDYGDIVLHAFLPEARQMYDLERLWADATPIDWKGVLSGEVKVDLTRQAIVTPDGVAEPDLAPV